jgi:hypothetical protein
MNISFTITINSMGNFLASTGNHIRKPSLELGKSRYTLQNRL